jgi:hypothetical protein
LRAALVPWINDIAEWVSSRLWEEGRGEGNAGNVFKPPGALFLIFSKNGKAANPGIREAALISFQSFSG